MDIEALKKENEYLRSKLKEANGCVHYQVVAMKAAYIAGETIAPETGMEWLGNYLWGPGLLPTEEELKMGPDKFLEENSK